ncbi:MAG: hypothetical protein H6728_02765 [Myxococcales bacterium]|nr:hypothetical protein [Myxococcales bacterium]MCB9641975.1 hypothetical protein [Myxococcales bacterium]
MSRISSPPTTPMLQGGTTSPTEGGKGPAQGGEVTKAAPQAQAEGTSKGTAPGQSTAPGQATAPQKGSFETHQATALLGADAPSLESLLGKDATSQGAGLSKAGLGLLLAEKAMEKGKAGLDGKSLGKGESKGDAALKGGKFLGGKGKAATGDTPGKSAMLSAKNGSQARQIQRGTLTVANQGAGKGEATQGSVKGGATTQSQQAQAGGTAGKAAGDATATGGKGLAQGAGVGGEAQVAGGKGETAQSAATTGGKALAQTPAQTATSQGADGKAAAQGGTTMQGGASAQGAATSSKAQAQTTAQGMNGAQSAGTTQATDGKAATTLGASLGGAAATTTASSAQTAEKPQSGSVKDLLMSATTQSGKTDNTPDSPRQQLKQLVIKWATAQEATALQNLHTVMLHDVSGVANRIASLAQQGIIPSGQLMSLLTKILKKPGQRKLMNKIKDMLIKKGASSCMSAEMLQLLAAMIATNLAKGGDDDAEALLIDLFDRPSRRIELPEGGGSYHEEGREEQEHQERIFFDPNEDPVV